MDNPFISILIPAKNEAENLPSLLSDIQHAMHDRQDFEVLVVDDGSTDDTSKKLLSTRHELTFPLRIFRHSSSLGQTTSLYRAAHKAHGQWLVTLDGDGQNDPADIPRLLALLESSGDAANGIKLLAGHRVNRCDSAVKRVSSKLANGLRSWLLGDGTPDTGCGLKVIDRDVFLQLPYFDHMHRFIPALVLRHGYNIKTVPVNHRHRMAGISNYGTLDRALVGIVDLIGVSWLMRRTRFDHPIEEVETNDEC